MLARYCKNSLISLVITIHLSLAPTQMLQAQNAMTPNAALHLPSPIYSSNVISSEWPMMRAVTVDPQQPWHMDFIFSTSPAFEQQDLRQEYQKLVTYFMTAMTVPDDHLWVNLSPNDAHRIIPADLGQTRLGRELLAQDYLLKKLTSALILPDSESGRQFWAAIYQRLYDEKLEVDLSAMDLSQRVWILPADVVMYQDGHTGWVLSAPLKVMMNQEYDRLLNLHQSSQSDPGLEEIFRRVIIPVIEEFVNKSSEFAPLRQIIQTIVLAHWFKSSVRKNILHTHYVNQQKMAGLQDSQLAESETVYEQYLQLFRQGAFEIIKEDYDVIQQEIVTHKYIAGGVQATVIEQNVQTYDQSEQAHLSQTQEQEIKNWSQNLNQTTVKFDQILSITDWENTELPDLIQGYFDTLDQMQRAMDLHDYEAYTKAYHAVIAVAEQMTAKAEQANDLTKVLETFSKERGNLDTQQHLQTLTLEVLRAGARQISETTLSVAQEVAKFTAESLGRSAKEINDIQTLLIDSVDVLAIRNFLYLPKDHEDFEVFLSKRQQAAEAGLNSSRIRDEVSMSLTMTGGMQVPYTGKVLLHTGDPDDVAELAGIVIHEFTHLLMEEDVAERVIEKPAASEDLTHAVQLWYSVREAKKDNPAVEANLQRFQDILGVPHLQEIWEHFKSLTLQGQAMFMVNPGYADQYASYFSIDHMLGVITDIFESHGSSTDLLLDLYWAQRSAAVAIAAIMTGLEENANQKGESINAFALLRDYFKILHDYYADPTADSEIAEHIKASEELVKNHAKSLGFPVVELINKDHGSWTISGSRLKKQIEQVVSDYYPRPYDGSSQKERLAAARERALGQLYLASTRQNSRLLSQVQLSDEIKSHPAFHGLWSVITAPRTLGIWQKTQNMSQLSVEGVTKWIRRVYRDRYAIGIISVDDLDFLTRETETYTSQDLYVALELLGVIDTTTGLLNLDAMKDLTARRIVSQSNNVFNAEQAEDIIRYLKRLPEAHQLMARSKYARYLPHQQFRDTLQFSLYQQMVSQKFVRDPRLGDPQIEDALERSRGGFNDNETWGWMKLLFENINLKPDQISRMVSDVIWPQYLKLYDQAIETEKLWRAYQRMQRERQEQIRRQQFDKMMADERLQQDLQEWFDSLPQSTKEAIEKAAQDHIQKQESDDARESSGQASIRSGGSDQSESSMDVTGSGRSIPQQSPSSQVTPTSKSELTMDQQLSELDGALKNLAQQIDDLKQDLLQIKDQAGQMKDQSQPSPGKTQDQQATQSSLESALETAQQNQEQALDMLESGRDIGKKAADHHQQTQKIAAQLPSPEEGKPSVGATKDLKEQSKVIERQLQKLLDQARALKDELEGALDHIKSHPQSNQKAQLQRIANAIKSLEAAADQTAQAIQKGQSKATQAQQQLTDLSKQIQDMKQRLDQEAADMTQGKPSDQKPNDNNPGSNSPKKENDLLKIPDKITLPDDINPWGGQSKPITTSRPKASFSNSTYNPANAKVQKSTEDLLSGLTDDERLELNEFFAKEIQQNGEDITVRQFVERIYRKMQGLLKETIEPEYVTGLVRGGIFDDPIEEQLDGNPYADHFDSEKLPLAVTLLIDRSGSAGLTDESGQYTRIEMEQILALSLADVVLQLNEKRSQLPIELDIRFFEEDGEILVSHEDVVNGKVKKDKALHTTLKKLVPGGATELDGNSQVAFEQLQDRPDPRGLKMVRILVIVTDAEIHEAQQANLKQSIDKARNEHDIYTLMVVMGGEDHYTKTVQYHDTHTEQIINPYPFATLTERFWEAIQAGIKSHSVYRNWNGEGPAMRVGGGKLSRKENLLVNATIKSYFDPVEGSQAETKNPPIVDDIFTADTLPDMGQFANWGLNYATLDPDGILKEHNIRINFLRGFEAKIQSDEENPITDLVSHPSSRYNQITMDSERAKSIMRRSKQWRQKWARHELYEILNPTASSDEVKQNAPVPTDADDVEIAENNIPREVATKYPDWKRLGEYQLFYHGTVDGRPVLGYYDPADQATGKPSVLKFWERGLGGPNVPETTVASVLWNEYKMAEILDAKYMPNHLYSSISQDHRWYIQEDHKGWMKVMAVKPDGGRQEAHRFSPIDYPDYDDDVGVYYKSQTLTWRMNDQQTLQMRWDDRQSYFDIEGLTNLSQAEQAAKNWMLHKKNRQQVFAYNLHTQRLLIITYQTDENKWSVQHDLRPESQEVKNEIDTRRYAALIGPTGVGKDTLDDAAMAALNQEVYVFQAHGEVYAQDLQKGQRSISNGDTGIDPSAVMVALERGAAVRITEGHTIKPQRWAALKNDIVEMIHSQVEVIDGRQKLVTGAPNHVLARITTSENQIRPNIEGQGTIHDVNMQRRKKALYFTWLPPQQEKEMLFYYVIQYARDHGLYQDTPEIWQQFVDTMTTYIDQFVDAVIPLRLNFLGYGSSVDSDASQQQLIYENWNLLNPALAPWHEKFKDGPQFTQGYLLKRAPSPRVLKNILLAATQFQKDLTFPSFELAKYYFNFTAEEDKNNSQGQVDTIFETVFGLNNGARGELIYDETDFVVDGQFLRLTPKVDANGQQDWHEVVVRLHPLAAIRFTGLPETVKIWITTPENRMELYRILQMIQMGTRGFILVGDKGTGKSTFRTVVQDLLDARGRRRVLSINAETTVRDLTVQYESVKGETFWDLQFLAETMIENGVGALEEANQARPSVLSSLSEYLAAGRIPDRRNPGQFIYAGHSILIMTMNRAETAHFLKWTPDHILERVGIFGFQLPSIESTAKRLHAENLQHRMLDSSTTIVQRIHPHIIGESMSPLQFYPNPTSPNDPDYQKPYAGQERMTGLLGLMQEIARLDKNILPKTMDESTLRDIMLTIKRQFTTLAAQVDPTGKPRRHDDILKQIIMENFILEWDSSQKEHEWRHTVMTIMKDMGMYDPDSPNDQLIEYLGGDPILLPDLEPFADEPATGHEELDELLVKLQIRVDQSNVDKMLKRIRDIISGALEDKGWQNNPLAIKIERLQTIRQVYLLLDRIIDQDPPESENRSPIPHTEATISAIELLLSGDIIDQVVNQKHWPVAVFDPEATWLTEREQYSKELIDQAESGQAFGVDELLVQVIFFSENNNYVTQRLKALSDIIADQPALASSDLDGLRSFKDLLLNIDDTLFSDAIEKILTIIGNLMEQLASPNQTEILKKRLINELETGIHELTHTSQSSPDPLTVTFPNTQSLQRLHDVLTSLKNEDEKENIFNDNAITYVINIVGSEISVTYQTEVVEIKHTYFDQKFDSNLPEEYILEFDDRESQLGKIVLKSSATEQQIIQCDLPEWSRIESISLQPGGDTLAIDVYATTRFFNPFSVANNTIKIDTSRFESPTRTRNTFGSVYSPDGKLLFQKRTDDFLDILDENGKNIIDQDEYLNLYRHVETIAVSPMDESGQYHLAMLTKKAFTEHSIITIWSMPTGELVREINIGELPEPIFYFGFTSSERLIFVTKEDYTINVLDNIHETDHFKKKQHHNDDVLRAWTADDRDRYFADIYAGKLNVWSWSNMHLQAFFPISGWVEDMLFVKNSDEMLVLLREQDTKHHRLYRWRFLSGDKPELVLTTEYPVSAMAVSPDQQSLALGYNNGIVEIYDWPVAMSSVESNGQALAEKQLLTEEEIKEDRLTKYQELLAHVRSIPVRLEDVTNDVDEDLVASPVESSEQESSINARQRKTLISKLIAIIKNENERVAIRRRSIDILHHLKSSEIIPEGIAMIKAFQEHNDEAKSLIYQRLIKVLGKLRAKDAVDLIVKALKNSSQLRDQALTQTIIEALADIGDPKVVGDLIATYQDFSDTDNINIASLILIALGRIGGDQARDFLINGFESDKNIQTRPARIKALGYFRDTVVIDKLVELLDGLLNRREDEIQQTYATLSQIGDSRSVPKLLDHLKDILPDASPDIAISLIETIGALGDASAADHLFEKYKETQSIPVNIAIIEALDAVGGQDLPNILAQIFNEVTSIVEKKDLEVPLVAAIVKRNDPQTNRILMDAMDRVYLLNNPQATAIAIQKFIEKDERATMGYLLDALKSDNKYAARNYALMLTYTDREQALAPLFAYAQSIRETPDVDFAEYLAVFRGIIELMIRLKNTSVDVHDYAKKFMSFFVDVDPQEPWHQYLNQGRVLFLSKQVVLLSSILVFYGDTDAINRIKEVIEILKKYHLTDQYIGNIYQSAANNLAKFGTPDVIEFLKGQITEETAPYLIPVLATIESPDVIAFLINRLENLANDSEEIPLITEALGEIGDIRALEPLIKLFQDNPRRINGFSGDQDHIINAISQLEYDPVYDRMMDLLDSDNENDRLAAVKVLLTMMKRDQSATTVDPSAAVISDDAPLSELSQSQRQSLISKLYETLKDHNQDPTTRVVSAEVLQKMKALGHLGAIDKVIPDLINIYETTENLEVKGVVITAIGMIGGASARQFLLDMFEQRQIDNIKNRPEIIEALSQFSDINLVDKLVKYVADNHDQITTKEFEVIFKILGRKGDQTISQRLLENLNQGNYILPVLITIVEAIGEIGDPRAVDRLVEIMQEQKFIVFADGRPWRQYSFDFDAAIIKALQKITGKDRPDVFQNIFQNITASAHREESEVPIVEALAELHDGRSSPTLEMNQIYELKNPRARAIIIQKLMEDDEGRAGLLLGQNSRSPDADISKISALALADVGRVLAIEPLRIYLSNLQGNPDKSFSSYSDVWESIVGLLERLHAAGIDVYVATKKFVQVFKNFFSISNNISQNEFDQQMSLFYQVLALYQDVSYIEDLEGIIKRAKQSNRKSIYKTAAYALAKFGTPDVIDFLKDQITEKTAPHLIPALATIKDTDVVDFLYNRLASLPENSDEKLIIIKALGVLGNVKALDLLIETFQAQNDESVDDDIISTIVSLDRDQVFIKTMNLMASDSKRDRLLAVQILSAMIDRDQSDIATTVVATSENSDRTAAPAISDLNLGESLIRLQRVEAYLKAEKDFLNVLGTDDEAHYGSLLRIVDRLIEMDKALMDNQHQMVAIVNKNNQGHGQSLQAQQENLLEQKKLMDELLNDYQKMLDIFQKNSGKRDLILMREIDRKRYQLEALQNDMPDQAPGGIDLDSRHYDVAVWGAGSTSDDPSPAHHFPETVPNRHFDFEGLRPLLGPAQAILPPAFFMQLSSTNP